MLEVMLAKPAAARARRLALSGTGGRHGDRFLLWRVDRRARRGSRNRRKLFRQPRLRGAPPLQSVERTGDVRSLAHIVTGETWTSNRSHMYNVTLYHFNQAEDFPITNSCWASGYGCWVSRSARRRGETSFTRPVSGSQRTRYSRPSARTMASNAGRPSGASPIVWLTVGPIALTVAAHGPSGSPPARAGWARNATAQMAARQAREHVLIADVCLMSSPPSRGSSARW